MNYAIIDLKAMISDIVSNVGADAVAKEMADNWNDVNKSDIPGFVANYFENEVDEEDADAILDEVYNEFYGIAANNGYTITTFDQ